VGQSFEEYADMVTAEGSLFIPRCIGCPGKLKPGQKIKPVFRSVGWKYNGKMNWFLIMLIADDTMTNVGAFVFEHEDNRFFYLSDLYTGNSCMDQVRDFISSKIKKTFRRRSHADGKTDTRRAE